MEIIIRLMILILCIYLIVRSYILSKKVKAQKFKLDRLYRSKARLRSGILGFARTFDDGTSTVVVPCRILRDLDLDYRDIREADTACKAISNISSTNIEYFPAISDAELNDLRRDCLTYYINLDGNK